MRAKYMNEDSGERMISKVFLNEEIDFDWLALNWRKYRAA